MSGPTRVLIADPDEVVRLGVGTLLDSEPTLRVCGETASGQAALQLATRRRPAILLLEIEMPDLDGVEVCRRLAALPSGPAVVFYTGRSDERSVIDALSAGASGYLPKGTEGRKLVDALRDVAEGGCKVDAQAATQLLARFRQLFYEVANEEVSLLSERERRLVVMIAAGYRNREIGEAFHLSEKTIRNKLSQINRKLGFERREQAAAWVGRHQLQLPVRGLFGPEPAPNAPGAATTLNGQRASHARQPVAAAHAGSPTTRAEHPEGVAPTRRVSGLP